MDYFKVVKEWEENSGLKNVCHSSKPPYKICKGYDKKIKAIEKRLKQ